MDKNLNIMQLVSKLEYGGAEILSLNICKYLLNKENIFSFICSLHGTNGGLSALAESEGVSFRYLDGKNKSKLKIMQDLFYLLKKGKVDIIQVHGSYMFQFVVLPALMAGTRIIYTEHSRHSLTKYPRLWNFSMFLGAYKSKVICVSNDLYDYLTNYVGMNPSWVEVIHNGIDLSCFTPSCAKTDRPKDHEELIIGTVGRLSEPKDHGNLLKAFSSVVKKVPNVRLMLVGEGELRRNVEDMIQQLGLEEKVCMLGARGDIPELLLSMDIFALSSKREGFPISLLEAMACGRPVIATDVGGVREIVSSGEDGMVVPPEDHESLSKGLLELVEDEDLRERMGKNAAKKALSSFSEQAMMEKYLCLYTKGETR